MTHRPLIRAAVWAAASCIAVASYQLAGAATASAAWSIVPTPSPAGASTSSLTDVSCAAARAACVAVGYFTDRAGAGETLAERWDGRRWAIQPTPTAALARRGRVTYLAGVSCPSATACLAVGHSGNGAGTTGTTLAERWDGRHWGLEPTTGPAGSKVSFLSGVSCTSPTACTAVGHAVERSGLAVTLAERWDGSRWARQRTPTPLRAHELISGS